MLSDVSDVSAGSPDGRSCACGRSNAVIMYTGIDGKLRKLKPGAWTGWRKIVRDQAVGDFYDRDGKGQWRRKRNC